MNTPLKASPILIILNAICVKYNKGYAYPSQLKILELMQSRQHLRKSRATLNRWLRAIEDEKYLKRKRRVGRKPHYGLVFKSSLYMITLKGYYHLRSLGVDVSKQISRIMDHLRDIGVRGDSSPRGKNRLRDLVDLVNMATIKDGARSP